MEFLKKQGSLRIAGIWLFIFHLLFSSCYRFHRGSMPEMRFMCSRQSGEYLFDQLIIGILILPAAFINLDFVAQLIAKGSGIELYQMHLVYLRS